MSVTIVSVVGICLSPFCQQSGQKVRCCQSLVRLLVHLHILWVLAGRVCVEMAVACELNACTETLSMALTNKEPEQSSISGYGVESISKLHMSIGVNQNIPPYALNKSTKLYAPTHKLNTQPQLTRKGLVRSGTDVYGMYTTCHKARVFPSSRGNIFHSNAIGNIHTRSPEWQTLHPK